MQWGESVEWLEGMVEDDYVPQPLRDRPELPEHLAWLHKAFWAVSGDRQLGAMGGCGTVSFLAIDAYARRYRIADGDEFERFHHLIQSMDRAYLEWVAEQARQNAKK